jgi:hypothetical protein
LVILDEENADGAFGAAATTELIRRFADHIRGLPHASIAESLADP